MILVLDRGTDEHELREVLAELERRGLSGHVLDAAGKPLVHVIGRPTRAARAMLGMERVQALVATSGPRIRESGRRFYPFHFAGWCAAVLLCSAVLVLLSGFLPPGLAEPADPLVPPANGVGVPWYLRPAHAVVALFPGQASWAGWLLLLGVGFIVLILPILDRTRGSGLRQRWPVLFAGLALLGGLAFAMLSGGVS